MNIDLLDKERSEYISICKHELQLLWNMVEYIQLQGPQKYFTALEFRRPDFPV